MASHSHSGFQQQFPAPEFPLSQFQMSSSDFQEPHCSFQVSSYLQNHPIVDSNLKFNFSSSHCKSAQKLHCCCCICMYHIPKQHFVTFAPNVKFFFTVLYQPSLFFLSVSVWCVCVCVCVVFSCAEHMEGPDNGPSLSHWFMHILCKLRLRCKGL